MNENDELQPMPLLVILEEMTIGAVILILFSGMIWGAGITITLMSLANR